MKNLQALILKIYRAMRLIATKNNKIVITKSKYIVNRFKQRALELAYKTVNKQRVAQNKKKQKFVIYLKTLNKPIKTESDNRSRNNDKNTQSLQEYPIICSKLLGLNQDNKSVEQDLCQTLQTPSPSVLCKIDEQRLSIVVSSLDELKGPNQVHDVYSISTSFKHQPKLVFRRAKQADFDSMK